MEQIYFVHLLTKAGLEIAVGPSAGFSETFPRYHGLSKNGHLRFGDLFICPGSGGVAFGGRWKYPPGGLSTAPKDPIESISK